VRFAWIVGPGLLVPLLVGLTQGVAVTVRRRAFANIAGPSRRALISTSVVVLVMIPVYTGFAVLHPITFGMLRFFAILAPAFALLTVAGLRVLLDKNRRYVWVVLSTVVLACVFLWNHPVHSDTTLLDKTDYVPAVISVIWLALYISPPRIRSMAPILVMVLGVIFLIRSHGETLHWKPSSGHANVTRAAELMSPQLDDEPTILSANPLLAYYLELNPYDERVFPALTSTHLAHAAPGTWLFWDTHYMPTHGSAFSLSAITREASWKYLGGVVASDSVSAGAAFKKQAIANDSTPPMLPGTMRADTWAPLARLIQAGIPRTRQKVEEDSGNARLWRSLAFRLINVGMLRDASEALARAERLDSEHVENTLLRLAVLQGQDKQQEAFQLARSALVRYPDNGLVKYQMGKMLVAAGRRNEARPLILSAAEQLPEEWNVQYLAGFVLLQEKRWAEAERYLEIALRLKPDSPEVRLYTAAAARRQEKLARSEELLRKLVADHARFARGYVALGEVLHSQGHTHEARQVWQTGFEATGDPALRALLDKTK
jgi:tetratricopeptide (TPR) repeat protein